MSGGTNSSSCPPYDSKDYTKVAIAGAVSGFVSLLASCFVISVMILLKKWRYFSQRLILYLAIAALLFAMSTILHRVDYRNQTSEFHTRFCVFGGFLEQVTSWIFLNANSSITFYLFANVVAKKNTEHFETAYFIFIFLTPFTFNWIPFIQTSYGRSGAWCWIRTDDIATCDPYPFGQYLVFLLWYVPLYITLIVLICLYVVILFRLHRASKEWMVNQTPESTELWNRTHRDVLPLMAYPAIYFALSFPPLVNRTQGWADPGNPSLALWYVSAVSFPLQGGLIAVAYCLDPGTRKRLRWNNLKAMLREFIRGESTSPKEYAVEYVEDEGMHTEWKRDALPQ